MQRPLTTEQVSDYVVEFVGFDFGALDFTIEVGV